jgi:hypothetical protein
MAYIDLDLASGQTLVVGNTTTGTGQIAIRNTSDGQVIASLDQFLNFGGATTKTANASTLTIDIYGRVVGFEVPDDFYYSSQNFTATSGQTLFTPTARNPAYITGQDLIFKNGVLLLTSDYTETSTTFTLNVGARAGDNITCISMRCKTNAKAYIPANIIVQSVSGAVVTYDVVSNPYQYIIAGTQISFTNVGTPTTYTVSSVNYTTRQITFTSSVTGVTIGQQIYYARPNNYSYPAFSRYEFDLTNASTYTPTTWDVDSGFELLFLNGIVMPDPDYNIISGAITAFPDNATGKMVNIQFNANNLSTAVGTPVNSVTNTTTGVSDYAFSFDPNAFNLYDNGVYLIAGTDYTVGTDHYTFSVTPTNNTTILLQQTFTRTNAV